MVNAECTMDHDRMKGCDNTEWKTTGKQHPVSTKGNHSEQYSRLALPISTKQIVELSLSEKLSLTVSKLVRFLR